MRRMRCARGENLFGRASGPRLAMPESSERGAQESGTDATKNRSTNRNNRNTCSNDNSNNDRHNDKGQKS